VNALGLELEGAADLLWRAGVRVEPSSALRLTADYVSYADSAGDTPFLAPGTREQWSLSGRLIPGAGRGAVILEAEASRTATTSGTRSEGRGGAALQLENMVFRPYVRAERFPVYGGSEGRGYLGMDATFLPRRSLGAILGAVWLQGHGEVEVGGPPSNASVVLTRNIGPGFRIETGARWDRASPGTTFTFALVSQLQAVRSTSVVTAPSTGGPTRLDQSVAGSVVWSQGGGSPLLSAEPSLDRGGVGGQVFLDLDADGRREDGEPILPGVHLSVANLEVRTDAAGRYQVWGLSPYQEVLVMMDTTSLASPWWVPAFAAASVTPAPNLVRTTDIPVVVSGVIEGSVVLEGVTSAIAGRPLPIIVTETGTGTRTVVPTFSDGTFYRMGLRPGRYEAAVDPDTLRRLGLRGETIRFEIKPGRQASAPGPTITGLRIGLRTANASRPPER
jgi:hypothetical protein